jgi:hypothetical protein
MPARPLKQLVDRNEIEEPVLLRPLEESLETDRRDARRQVEQRPRRRRDGYSFDPVPAGRRSGA